MALASLSFGVLAALSTIGALIDVLKRKLPNYLSLAIAIAGLGFAFAAAGWVGLGLHFAHVVVAFLLGYGLFAGGMFGAGDGKFYAGVAAFSRSSSHPRWPLPSCCWAASWPSSG